MSIEPGPTNPESTARAWRRGVLLVLLCAGCLASAASDSRVRSAGCYVALPEGVLVTVGRFNGALQLPGGVREAGESPPCTAQRETYEETGLVVDVAEQLASRNGGRFILYRCLPRASLRADTRLRAPDFLEVAEVLILDPLTLRTPSGATRAERWRFAQDHALISALFRAGPRTPERVPARDECPLKQAAESPR